MLLVVAVVVAVPGIILSLACTSWDASRVCMAYAYRPFGLPLLFSGAFVMAFGILALAFPRPRDRFSQELHCPECGRRLEPHPETDRWHCPHCGKDFRAHTEEAFYRDRGVY